MKKKFNKIIFLALILPLTLGFSGARLTNAFYNDAETSGGNSFSASMLDFILTNNNLNKLIGPEALGEISHASVVMPVDGSLPMQYTLSNNILTNDSDFCSKLTVEAKLNGISKYTGPLSGLAFSTTTEFGTWEFRFDLPPNISVPNGAQCNTGALFSAWRADITNPADSSWHDEETLNISFTERMIVLNEIFANPKTGDKEFIEFYNNGSTDVDVVGWKLSEISGSTEKFYTISATTELPKTAASQSGSTVIPANGYLAFYLSDSTALNNSGDTVKLYDSTTTLLDSHTYPAVSAGKSVVRYPDGIGFWVDPEPTPGTTIIVSLEDLRVAGFDDAMIAQVLELVALKNSTLLNNNGENQIKAASVVQEILPPVEEKGTVAADGGTPPEAVVLEPVIESEVITEILEIVETIAPPAPEPIIESQVIVEPQPSPEATAGEAEPVVESEPIIIPPVSEPAPATEPQIQ